MVDPVAWDVACVVNAFATIDYYDEKVSFPGHTVFMWYHSVHTIPSRPAAHCGWHYRPYHNISAVAWLGQAQRAQER